MGLVVLGLAFALVFVSNTVPHLWYAAGKANVTFSDGSSGTARVYKSKNGEYLFSISDEPAEIYLYFPATNLIGIPNGDQFAFIPLFAYSKDAPVPVVFSNNKVKADTDMNIVIEDKKVQFTTFRGRRIEADLGSY
jgi:hypothetical protein